MELDFGKMEHIFKENDFSYYGFKKMNTPNE